MTDQPKSRKVAGYVKAVLKLRAVLHQKDECLRDVNTRHATLNGGQMAEANRLLKDEGITLKETVHG